MFNCLLIINETKNVKELIYNSTSIHPSIVRNKVYIYCCHFFIAGRSLNLYDIQLKTKLCNLYWLVLNKWKFLVHKNKSIQIPWFYMRIWTEILISWIIHKVITRIGTSFVRGKGQLPPYNFGIGKISYIWTS